MAMFDDLKKGLTEVDAFLAGKHTGYKVTVPEEIDVKNIRKRLHMTQAGFSNAFGFSLDAVKHWEGARRTPEAPVRAYLKVISKNPKAVLAALQDKKPKAKRAHTAPRLKTSPHRLAFTDNGGSPPPSEISCRNYFFSKRIGIQIGTARLDWDSPWHL